MRESAHRFIPTIYDRLGVDLNKLGCVMLRLQPITEVLDLDPLMLYTSTNPDLFWVKGAVGAEKAHVTLRYGLLELGGWRQYVPELLADWPVPEAVGVTGLEVFPSAIPGENYACIVARVDVSPLILAHERLGYLPHINTFPGYKAHATLAYVDRHYADDALKALERILWGPRLGAAPLLVNTDDPFDLGEQR